VATLAERIAQFHQTAEPRYDHGGHAGMRWVIDGNALAFAEHAGTLDPGMAARVTTLSREALARHGGVLDERQHLRRVRQCHGDLHLRNIVLIDDEPTLFDGVEFNDEIACVDVLYDLAFVLMDLLKRDLPVQANLLSMVISTSLTISTDCRSCRSSCPAAPPSERKSARRPLPFSQPRIVKRRRS